MNPTTRFPEASASFHQTTSVDDEKSGGNGAAGEHIDQSREPRKKAAQVLGPAGGFAVGPGRNLSFTFVTFFLMTLERKQPLSGLPVWKARSRDGDVTSDELRSTGWRNQEGARPIRSFGEPLP